MKLRYFSHSSFQITTDAGQIIFIDPFFDGNPTAPVAAWTAAIWRSAGPCSWINGDGSIGADDVILQRHGALPAEFRDGVTTTPADLRFTDSGALRFDPGVPVTDFNIQICDQRGDVDTGNGIAAGRWIQISGLGRQQLVRTRTVIQSDRNPLGGC